MNASRMFFAQLVMHLMPSTRLFGVKRALLRFAGAGVAVDARVCSSARFQIGGNLKIGRRSWIGPEVLIVGGSADVTIGADVDIGPRAMIVAGTHKISQSGRVAGDGYSLPIRLDDGCWIGAGAIVMGGVRVGSRAVVAAGAVVREDVPAGAMVGGVPARVLVRGSSCPGLSK